jgi:hypothetical protein
MHQSQHAFSGKTVEIGRISGFQFRGAADFPWQASKAIHDQQNNLGVSFLREILHQIQIRHVPSLQSKMSKLPALHWLQSSLSAIENLQRVLVVVTTCFSESPPEPRQVDQIEYMLFSGKQLQN